MRRGQLSCHLSRRLSLLFCLVQISGILISISTPVHSLPEHFEIFSPKTSSRHFHKRSNILPDNAAAAALNEGSKGGRQEIKECIMVSSAPGSFELRSRGEKEACGVYFVANADEVIEVELEAMDVTCNNGLVVFLDGWEMNGKIFPSPEDHHLPMKERFTEMCTSANNNVPGKRFVRSRRFVSSQNAALIQYRVSQVGEGFAFRVRYIRNPEPCNVLMSDIDGIYTLSNFGKERNCSLTTLLFPANLRVLEMSLGQGDEEKECCAGGSDLVEFGGASDLQSNNLLAKQTMCGCDSKRVVGNKGLTVLCGSSTVRLVSSGLHSNRISVFAKVADEADLDMDNNMLLMCPDFM